MYLSLILILSGMLHKPQIYNANGIIINQNQIMTDDGNIWNYDTEYKANTLVTVKFTDMGTDEIFDDIIVEVKDIYTSIYDELEKELNTISGYYVERNGNNLIIKEDK